YKFTTFTANYQIISRLNNDLYRTHVKYIYVFEFKLNGTAEEALQQIEDKGYLIPYQADGREVIKLGVEFSAEERNISRWLNVM
ncbi:PD-(D/E)XK nuclease domain-containing protein, partial [Bacteroides intestinalis]|uniref:PD-(D/E)XK nuclease domain-containing protein n=1 Tax=Bacteroides intestinalis TaxID=329854 RepID=UPI0032EAA2C0